MDASFQDTLIYDWNFHNGDTFKPAKLTFDDETLRDGLQGPSITDPPIKDKIEILHLMNDLGIQSAALGLPGAGPHVVRDVTQLAQEIVDQKLAINANCSSRTMREDIQPIIDISQKTGLAIEACTFIGSSPIRTYTENWGFDFLLKCTEEAITFAVKNDMEVMFVTEDTIRSRPEDLKQLYTVAINSGAKRVCLCDTVGHATPEGTYSLVRFIGDLIKELGIDVEMDWHGHRDRGLSVANSIAAIRAGVTRIHGCALGAGERVGNTPMDALLVNCKLMGWVDNDLKMLNKYCQKVSQALGVPLPNNYPIIGEDAYKTGTGVHASAIIKAEQKESLWLVDYVYSGVPANMLGREQIIEIGPMSGISNVTYWLKKRNIEPKKEWVDAIFRKAKLSKKTLSEEDIYSTIGMIKEE